MSDIPQVRVTGKAHKRLKVIVAAERRKRGVNVSMTDIASEAILSYNPDGKTSTPVLPVVEVHKKEEPRVN